MHRSIPLQYMIKKKDKNETCFLSTGDSFNNKL